LFEAYVAVVFLEGGLPAVNEWLMPLMETVDEDEDILAVAQALRAATLGGNNSPGSTSGSNMTGPIVAGTFSLFNQRAAQLGLIVTWREEAKGEAHKKTWLAKLHSVVVFPLSFRTILTALRTSQRRVYSRGGRSDQERSEDRRDSETQRASRTR
jgi:hypothetical protein